MRFSSRLAKLEASIVGKQTGYRLPDGSVKYIPSKKVYATFIEACDGIDTPGARIMLAATACVNPGAGRRLHEVAQSLQNLPGEIVPWDQALVWQKLEADLRSDTTLHP
jgi:hypothetical protein